MKFCLKIGFFGGLFFWFAVNSVEAGTLDVYFRDQNVHHTLFTLYDGQIEYINLNKVADVFRLAVNIDSIDGRVILQYGNQSASFIPGRTSVIANQRTYYLDISPRKIEGIVMVPIQFLTTILPLIYESEIQWDAGTRSFIVAATAQVLQITDLSVSPFGEYTRIIIETNQPVSYKIAEKLPSLLIVELPQAEFRLAQNPLQVESRSVKHVKVVDSFGTTQVILRLASEFVRYTHQIVEAPPRVVIDVYHTQEAVVETREAEHIIEEDITVKPEQASPKTRASFTLRTVVIDPGHGGSDPGILVAPATDAVPELFEKQLTLYVAQMLRTSLMQRFGNVRVVLTREGDNFVSAENRMTIANHNRADAFMSLHVNNSPSSAKSGFEVYVMDYGSIDLPVGYEQLRAQLDYAQAASINQSTRFAEQIVAAYNAIHPEGSGRIKHAPLFTLKGAMMPAVHIEMSYASHPQEHTLLQQEEFLQALVSSITEGIAAFKKITETDSAQQE